MQDTLRQKALGIVVATWGAFAAGAGLAQAQTTDGQPAVAHPVVVELFTSQGCSSCPPADALLRELSQREDVIALALHVDYWDYIGWKDVFARPEHALRQRAYARATGDRMIYTPQIVVGGATRIAGAKAMAIMTSIEAHHAAPARIRIDTQNDDGAVLLQLTPLDKLDNAVIVQLVRFRPEGIVEILRGENAGQTLEYTNIVTAWDIVAEWDGEAPQTLRLDVPGDDEAVVLVQNADHGPILAAHALR